VVYAVLQHIQHIPLWCLQCYSTYSTSRCAVCSVTAHPAVVYVVLQHIQHIPLCRMQCYSTYSTSRRAVCSVTAHTAHPAVLYTASQIWCLHVNYRYFCQTVLQLELSQQIFDKYSNISFHENLSSARRVVPCGLRDEQTDGHETNSSFY
jgi:hypothetical protein